MSGRGHRELLRSKKSKHLGEPKKNVSGFKKTVQVTEFPFFVSPGIKEGESKFLPFLYRGVKSGKNVV